MSVVRMRLRLAQTSLEFEGDEALYERILAPLLAPLVRGSHPVRPARAAVPPRPPVPPPAPGAEGAPRSPAPPPAPPVPSYVPPSDRFGSFQRQRRPDLVGAADRIASYAFFLWNYDRREDFGEDEISGCFRADGVELPGDASDLCRALVEHRILEPVNGRDGTWRLTSKGRAHVRGHLLMA